jgi:phage tail-like protein
MADSIQTIEQTYPLAVYNYRVEIDGNAVAFSEVSGLDIAYDTTTYKESPTANGATGPVVHRMPAQPTTVTVSLKKGLVPKVSVPALYNWINTTMVNVVVKKDIAVRLMDEKGKPVISWLVSNAFPTKLTAPSFSASSNDAAIESLELMADSVTISTS